MKSSREGESAFDFVTRLLKSGKLPENSSMADVVKLLDTEKIQAPTRDEVAKVMLTKQNGPEAPSKTESAVGQPGSSGPLISVPLSLSPQRFDSAGSTIIAGEPGVSIQVVYQDATELRLKRANDQGRGTCRFLVCDSDDRAKALAPTLPPIAGDDVYLGDLKELATVFRAGDRIVFHGDWWKRKDIRKLGRFFNLVKPKECYRDQVEVWSLPPMAPFNPAFNPRGRDIDPGQACVACGKPSIAHRYSRTNTIDDPYQETGTWACLMVRADETDLERNTQPTLRPSRDSPPPLSWETLTREYGLPAPRQKAPEKTPEPPAVLPRATRQYHDDE